MTRRRAMGAASGAVGLLASWLVGFGGASVSRPDAITIPPAGYVALGDSYSAGEGLNPYLRGTQNPPFGNRCHRSPEAYGAVLAGKPDAHNFTFRACSGAVIAEVASADQTHGGVSVGGPQLRDLGDAGLITITIGGNDALFAEIVKFCALRFDCLDSSKWNRDGAVNLRTWANTRLKAIGSDLTAPLDQVESMVPDARVIVLGYPRLFTLHPRSGGQRSCLVYGLFSEDERRGLRKLGDRLNLEIARRTLAAGHEYVHVADVFDDHETCGAKGQWLQFFGIDPEHLTTKDIFDSGNFHPTSDGQAMIARLVRCYLDTHTESDVPRDMRDQALEATSLDDLVGDWPIGRSGDIVLTCARGD